MHRKQGFFKWKSNHSNSVKMLTTKFDTYWEKLVENYLNNNFNGIDENYELMLNKNKFKKIKFVKRWDYIEHEYIRKSNINSYLIEYDHIYRR